MVTMGGSLPRLRLGMMIGHRSWVALMGTGSGCAQWPSATLPCQPRVGWCRGRCFSSKIRGRDDATFVPRSGNSTRDSTRRQSPVALSQVGGQLQSLIAAMITDFCMPLNRGCRLLGTCRPRSATEHLSGTCLSPRLPPSAG